MRHDHINHVIGGDTSLFQQVSNRPKELREAIWIAIWLWIAEAKVSGAP